MSYYGYDELEDFAEFDDEYASWYVDEDVDVLYFGETDDGAHWAIAEDDQGFRAYLHKPGYAMGEPDEYAEWQENPLVIEYFDSEYDAFDFVSNTIGYDW